MRVAELLPSLLAAINGASRIAVASHVNPDGDAIGSTLAVAAWCRALGKSVVSLNNNPAPDYLSFLAGASSITTAADTSKVDLGIALDLESPDRLGSCRSLFESLPYVVTIDHHVPHESFGDLRIIDVGAAATCEILTELLLAAEQEITKEMAQALLTGIVTDTGSFRFSNTSPRTFELAGRLVACGGVLAEIAENVYARKPLPKVRLTGWVLDNMRLSEDRRVAWAAVPRRLFDELGAVEEHTEGIVNELLAIEGVEIAMLLRDTGTKVKASFRSRGRADVSAVAQELGGGGHRNASGASFDTTLEEAEKISVPMLESCLDSS